MTVYAVATPKGGTTKTTVAAEVVAELARRGGSSGRRVLAVDLDQQGTLTTRLGVTPQTPVEAVTADVLTGQATAIEAAIASPTVPSADVLVGTHDLANIDQLPEVLTALRDHLPAIATRWHDVVMDTPPAVGMATLAALAAADVVIAPVTTEAEALDQLPRLAQVIQERIARRVRPGQSIHWVIPSRYDGRRRLDREVIAELEARYPGRVTPPVRETVIAKDAFLQGMPVSLYRPTSAVAADYAAAMALILT